MIAMNEFIKYIEQYRGGYRFRGASEDAIARLAALYERPLPEDYLAFLRIMGGDLGGFCLLGDVSADIASVLDRTLDLVGDPFYEPLLTRCIIIGNQHAVSEDLALEDVGYVEPRVVSVDVGVLYPVARTLKHLLMRQAFAMLAMWEHPHRAYWSGRIDAPRADLEEELARLGFQALWFSDEQGWCGERPDARLQIASFDNLGVAVNLSAQDPALISTVGDRLAQRWGLQPY